MIKKIIKYCKVNEQGIINSSIFMEIRFISKSVSQKFCEDFDYLFTYFTPIIHLYLTYFSQSTSRIEKKARPAGRLIKKPISGIFNSTIRIRAPDYSGCFSLKFKCFNNHYN